MVYTTLNIVTTYLTNHFLISFYTKFLTTDLISLLKIVFNTLNIVTTDLISLLKITYKFLSIVTTDLTNHFLISFYTKFLTADLLSHFCFKYWIILFSTTSIPAQTS